MAAVTVTLIEHLPGGVDGMTMIVAKIQIASSGDTWKHGLRAAWTYGSNTPAEITKMTGDSDTCTFTTTGAVVDAKVWVLGWA